MSYAQRHRARLELHQSSLGLAPTSTEASPMGYTPPRKGVAAAGSIHGDRSSEGGGGGHPQRTTSSLLRANAAHVQQGHATGIDIAAWSEAASSAVAGDRQPFQLLQHTPPKNEPPRLKASRKQFASPHLSTTASETNQSMPVSLPIVVNSDSPINAADPPTAGAEAAKAPDATAEAAPTQKTSNESHDAPSQPHVEAEEEAERDTMEAGEMSPSPIPVSHQPSQPQSAPPPFAESSAPSSARASASQWPASETFSTRLRNIMDTRQQIEALVQKQREDEEEMVHAIAALDEQSHLNQSSQQQSPSSPTPRGAGAPAAAGGSADTVSRHAYDQVLMERNAAFAALREFKEKGNAIVHHLYDTVKTQQEQSLELVATVEALKKANKRLKEAVSNGGAMGSSGSMHNNGSGRASDAAPVPGTVAELQQKVATQRRVIEQMDQLMQNADRMLLTMRARVEAAERRAAAAATAPLDRRQLPPLPKGNAGTVARPAGPLNAAMVATPDAVAAIERLTERYANDADVATVAAQQQLLLERIAQLRQSLKQEEAQRLHLEEVYGATSEETARNVALLEERLQRAENPRGVPFATSGGASNNGVSNASALRHELHTLMEEKGEKKEEGDAEANTKDANAEQNEADTNKEASPAEEEAAFVEEEEEEEEEQQQQEPREQERPPTPSHASSRASSRSSTPTRTLFTAVSVGDVNSTTAANEIADSSAAVGAVSGLHVVVPTNSTDAPDLPAPHEVSAPPESGASDDPVSPLPVTSPKKDASPLPSHPHQQQQPRAFLGRRRSASSGDKGNGAAAAKGASPPAAATAKAPLGIPVPDASSLGNSLRRSFNSRSSSASRRIVDFRPAGAAAGLDATSRGLDSMSDVEEEEETVDVDGNDVEEKKNRKSTYNNNIISNNNRSSGITGVTPTITPTAIHSATSPLPDTSTSAEMSAKRQQRLHQQKEELDKLEADVTNVVRSLDVE